MSKAKSWTKLNLCSANGFTWPRQALWSSGALRTPGLKEHKVTNTTSQQSWATKESKTREAMIRVIMNDTIYKSSGLMTRKNVCTTFLNISTASSQHLYSVEKQGIKKDRKQILHCHQHSKHISTSVFSLNISLLPQIQSVSVSFLKTEWPPWPLTELNVPTLTPYVGILSNLQFQ